MADHRFAPDDFVTIDGKGKAETLERIVRTYYKVRVCGSEYECEIESNRLMPLTEEPVPSSTDQQTNRLSSVTKSDEIDNFIDDQLSKNTSAKTMYDLNILRQFFATSEVGEFREIQTIPVTELESLICRFFMTVKKQNGEDYEPNTLRAFMASFDRQLRRHNYGQYLSTSPNFARVREVLKGKQKELKHDGRGNLSNRADPISDCEVDKLWETGQFGGSTPDSILNTLWFYNTVHFGLRGRKDHRDMCWGDITLKTASNGHQYLEFQKRQTNIRTGVNPRDISHVTPKLWENLHNPDRDPVSVYKKYSEKRPLGYSSPDKPFYIATSTKTLPAEHEVWFKRNPVGINLLASMMPRMVKAAGISSEKNLSNQSARKYLVQKLSETNAPSNQIRQIASHTNVSSDNSNIHLNEQEHSNISPTLQSTDQSHETMTSNNQVNDLSSDAPVRPLFQIVKCEHS